MPNLTVTCYATLGLYPWETWSFLRVDGGEVDLALGGNEVGENWKKVREGKLQQG